MEYNNICSYKPIANPNPPPPQPLGAEGPTYPEMTKEAVSNALSDAGLPYEAIQAAVRYSTP